MAASSAAAWPAAPPGPGRRAAGAPRLAGARRRPGRPRAPRPVHHPRGGVHEAAAVEPGVAGDAQDLEGVEAPRAGGHHPHERGVVVGVRDRAQALLQVPDLGRLEQAQPADDRVRDVLVAQPGRRWRRGACACGTGRRRRSSGGRSPARPAARMASTMATASSSVPAHRWSSTGTPASRSVHRRLSGSKRVVVALDQPVGGVEDVADASGSSGRCGGARRPGAGPSGRGGRPRERGVELRERGEAAPRKR